MNTPTAKGSTMTFLRSLALIAAVLGSALIPTAAAAEPGATNFWFAPGGRGNGTAPDRPRVYSPNFMQWSVLNGGPGQVRDVTIHFHPGEYLVQPLDTTIVGPSEWKIRIRGLGKNPEDVVLKLLPNFNSGASDRGGNWVDVINLSRNNEYLQRFEMENLTIDGNWTGRRITMVRAISGGLNSPSSQCTDRAHPAYRAQFRRARPDPHHRDLTPGWSLPSCLHRGRRAASGGRRPNPGWSRTANVGFS